MRNSPRDAVSDVAIIALRPDLAGLYRAKACALTDAFEDESLRAEAFDSLRTLIKCVVFTLERDELAMCLRGRTGSDAGAMFLCRQEKPPPDCSEGALQIKLVAGVGFEPTTFRL